MDFDDFVVGYSGTFSKIIGEAENQEFAKISGDYNPVHFDDNVGRRIGFSGAVSNGFIQESLLAGALVNTFGSEDTIVVALEKNTRFLNPVYMGDLITAKVEVTARIPAMQALKILGRCQNQDGIAVVETRFTLKILSPAG
jgi:3-hydroxybutyryl-CoA dehydratase